MITQEMVLNELSKMIDPDFQRDIVSLGFVQDLAIDIHAEKVGIIGNYAVTVD